MEQLFGDNKLSRLEERIEEILRIYVVLKDERRSLTSRVEALETENRELKEQIGRSESEKETIMEKVKGILDKLEQLEV